MTTPTAALIARAASYEATALSDNASSLICELAYELKQSQTALAAARNEGIEAAAEVADGWVATFGAIEIGYVTPRAYATNTAQDIADGIRALKSPQDAAAGGAGPS